MKTCFTNPIWTSLQALREAQPGAVRAGANRSCAASWSWNGSWIENPRVWFSVLSQTLDNCKNSTWFTNNGCVSSPIPRPPVCPCHRGSNYRLGPATGHAHSKGRGTVGCVYVYMGAAGCMSNWMRCMYASVCVFVCVERANAVLQLSTISELNGQSY